MKKHYYCSLCLRVLNTEIEICPSCPQKKNSYFIQLPFFEQLEEMFKRKGFHDKLQWRFQKPNYPGFMTDIYDGCLYQKWQKNGFLSNSNNISFSWYTDGVPVFKSSKISIWPLYLSINELPFADRKKRENTLLIGLWFGNQKPQMNRFIYTFFKDFEILANDGIDITIPENNSLIKVRGILLIGTCDLPAKAECLNFVHFNGEYGCPFCLCKGKSEPISDTSSVYVFPYEPQPILRNVQDTMKHAAEALIDKPVMGVKGFSSLSKLMPDFIQGIAIDRMHGVDGGVVKKILQLLFDHKYRNFPFSLCEFAHIINARLTAIKPPKFVHRMPRSISDLLHWKASELKMWFFFYSIPVLKGILRNDYFEHYLLLVTAITMLNDSSISPEMVIVAEDLLHKFVKEFEILYGLRFCSINIHQLLHYPKNVLNLGPLWANTCFQYEDINGQLLKMVHGTRHIDSQIAKSQIQYIKMIRKLEYLSDGEIYNFCIRKKASKNH